ncbi:hypothetical protein TsFJ059_007490 [Trichoderma semiorbis]|uniref:Uncharacterized protein n=1 Tax=Trichoderma semiorbis TaxID=1491008 RepID=A0A9P8HM93_9HYPO|nr:hypothetical protein TsFJ059_007490 [Trichoderma semiorbis]
MFTFIVQAARRSTMETEHVSKAHPSARAQRIAGAYSYALLPDPLIHKDEGLRLLLFSAHSKSKAYGESAMDDPR